MAITTKGDPITIKTKKMPIIIVTIIENINVMTNNSKSFNGKSNIFCAFFDFSYGSFQRILYNYLLTYIYFFQSSFLRQGSYENLAPHR